MAYIVLNDLKLLLDINLTNTSEDSILQLFIDVADEVISEYTGIIVPVSSRVGVLYDGTGLPDLYIEAPVVNLTSLEIADTRKEVLTNGTLLTSDDYVITWGIGKISLVNKVFPKGLQNIRISYDTGYASTPNPIKQVALELAAKSYKDHRQGRFGLTGKAISSQASVRDEFVKTYMTPSTKALLDLYRNPLSEQVFSFT